MMLNAFGGFIDRNLAQRNFIKFKSALRSKGEEITTLLNSQKLFVSSLDGGTNPFKQSFQKGAQEVNLTTRVAINFYW